MTGNTTNYLIQNKSHLIQSRYHKLAKKKKSTNISGTCWIKYIQIGSQSNRIFINKKLHQYQNIRRVSQVKASKHTQSERHRHSSHIRQSLFWSITLAEGDVHTCTYTHTELLVPSLRGTKHLSRLTPAQLPPQQNNVRFVRQSRQILAFFIARVNRCRVGAKLRQKRRQRKGCDCYRIPSSLSHILIKYLVYVLVIGCLRVAVEMRDYATFYRQVTVAVIFKFEYIIIKRN